MDESSTLLARAGRTLFGTVGNVRVWMLGWSSVRDGSGDFLVIYFVYFNVFIYGISCMRVSLQNNRMSRLFHYLGATCRCSRSAGDICFWFCVFVCARLCRRESERAIARNTIRNSYILVNNHHHRCLYIYDEHVWVRSVWRGHLWEGLQISGLQPLSPSISQANLSLIWNDGL